MGYQNGLKEAIVLQEIAARKTVKQRFHYVGSISERNERQFCRRSASSNVPTLAPVDVALLFDGFLVARIRNEL